MDVPYRIQIKVVEVRGKQPCGKGFKVGDTLISESNKPPPDICMLGYNAMLPAIYALRYGCASFPWEPEEGMTLISCPDPYVVVVFELRRLLD